MLIDAGWPRYNLSGRTRIHRINQKSGLAFEAKVTLSKANNQAT